MNVCVRSIIMAALVACGAGCFSIQTGTSVMELPTRVSGVPSQIVDVDQFDGIEAKAIREGDIIKFSFVAKGRFRCKQNNKTTYRVPKKVAIGIGPGMLVPTEGWTQVGVPQNKFVKVCGIYVGTFFIFPLIDSLFVEPFSDYRPDLNASNWAQFGLIGCCKYYDTPHRELCEKKENDDMPTALSEFPLNGAIQIHLRGDWGRSERLPIALNEQGVGEIPAGVFQNAYDGVRVTMSFAEDPIIGGDLGEIIKRQYPHGKVFSLTLKEEEMRKMPCRD